MEVYDLIIVGGGVAGLCAALAAPEDARVIVVDKGEAGAGSSPLAQGGLAAAVGADDSVELHVEDTIRAGAGLCDAAIVEDVCAEGADAVAWLSALGCVFDVDEHGELDLAREGGQTVGRSVHWRDATGAEIVRALRLAVRDRSVARAKARATSLLTTDGRCVGVRAGADTVVLGRAVLLATGGAGGLWGTTTNAPGATADGIALALDVATVIDLEFMQFHPTVLASGAGQRPLLTEALRGEGATPVDARGERFVEELGPRHVVAKAILDHAPAFLDCTMVPRVTERFPTVAAACKAHGFDIERDRLPVEPAAHYFIGGVAAGAHGRTSLDGLFAAGECTSTGMHGANRLAGNSLLEAVVVGRRVGEQVGRQPAPPSTVHWTESMSEGKEMDARIPEIMWRGAGPVRSGESLTRALHELNDVNESSHRSLAAGIVEAALDREETRGVHVREDFPNENPALATRRPARGRIVGRVE